MKKTRILISLILLSLCFTALPTQELEAQVFERFSKRFLKKNRVKKVGKKLGRMGDATPLEDMAIRDDVEMIGFEPSWMIRNNSFEDHYFNLVSTLVIGEYDIDPTTGKVRNQENFRAHLTTMVYDKGAKADINIIKKADLYNPKINILLQISYNGDFGSQARKQQYLKNLLRNDQVHQTLKDSLNDYFLNLETNYNLPPSRTGIFVDVNLIYPDRVNEDFIDFIKFLRTELGEERLIYLRIPAKMNVSSYYNPHMVSAMQEDVNKFVIQGYGFEDFSQEPISTSLFKSQKPAYTVEGTLTEYLRVYDDQDFYREKFIVELPYFGVIWKKDRNGFRLNPGSHYITIDNFNRQVKGKNGVLRYYDDSLTAALEEGDSLIYAIEDSISLTRKYSYLIDSMGMTGFGLNALGYYTKPEHKRSEIWAAIADSYGEKREKMGWVIAMYLTAFIPLGFFLSVYQSWEVRNALAKFGNFWTRFRAFFLFFILVFLVCAGIAPRFILVVIGLIIMAGFFLYILVKKMIMRSKKYVNIVK